MKVVHHLAQQGYVETVRGKGGGMRLAQAPERINIGQVLRSSEGELAVVECFEDGNSRCPIKPVCGLRGVLGRAMQAFLDVVDAHTLADLLRPETKLVRIFRHARASP
jgi:Rrf2 family nitric oxide-sensitive transcriptional repressor